MYTSPVQSRLFPFEMPPQKFDMSRPSAKSIYMRRKEYSESINRQAESFHYRVEHLFTCELNQRGMSKIEDCVQKLKNLESRGKVWGQDMILQVHAGSLQLCDIETKEVMDSIPFKSILQTEAILYSCSYDSLLTVTVQENVRRPPTVYLFQCEETGAEEMRADLNKAIQNRAEEPEFQPREPPFDIKTNLEHIIGQGYQRGLHRPGHPLQSASPHPTEYPPPHHTDYQDYEAARSPVFSPRDDEFHYSPDIHTQTNQQPPTNPVHTDLNRSVEILNHLVDDIESFMSKVGSCKAQEDKSNKTKNKSKSQRVFGQNFPSIEEYVACLQKIKYAFNLLGDLNGLLTNPDAPVFVHSLFSSLQFLVMQYPPDVTRTVVSPLLTEKALQLLSQVVTPQEDQFWNTLGDPWIFPRSSWPNADQIPPYVPVFYDGWQPPAPVHSQSPPTSHSSSRSNSQQFPNRNGVQPPPHQDNRPGGAIPKWSEEPALYMRVIYTFTARNRQELSVMKGDVVQVIDKSKQWWTVRNNSREEGYVPPNILEAMRRDELPKMNRLPNLDTKSSPEEVKAWLQYKGFSMTTMRSLGMISGALLLGMKREDIRALCPEEGGRVFFQLQAIKSTIALASEAEYYGR